MPIINKEKDPTKFNLVLAGFYFFLAAFCMISSAGSVLELGVTKGEYFILGLMFLLYNDVLYNQNLSHSILKRLEQP